MTWHYSVNLDTILKHTPKLLPKRLGAPIRTGTPRSTETRCATAWQLALSSGITILEILKHWSGMRCPHLRTSGAFVVSMGYAGEAPTARILLLSWNHTRKSQLNAQTLRHRWQ